MTMDRRTFVRATGMTVIGTVAAACGAPEGATPPSTTGVTMPTGTAAPDSPLNWNKLRGQLSHGLVQPSDEGFEQAKRVFNPLFDNRKPAAIARCGSTDDVRVCVEAAAGRVPIAARGGGHSYAGYSAPDGGLVLDLAPMSKVDVQGDRAVVGAGAKLKDVYAALGAAARSLPAGSCPSVGIAGLTLGGGLSVLSRKYGLTCDHLVSAEVVTADGSVRTASAESEPELFWALRGGGGGNFVIVTSFTFRTDPAPWPAVFSLDFPAGAAADVVGAWQAWVAGAPRELWSTLLLSAGGNSRVSGCFVGTQARLAQLLDNFTATTGKRPARTMQSLDFLGAMRYFATSEDRQTFVAGSRILREPTAEPGKLAAFAEYPDLTLQLDSLGGAIADVAPADTAFWHRGALASIQVYQRTTPQHRDAARKTVTDVVDGLATVGATGGYVNYVDPSLPDWMNAYYGDNAARLQRVASTYDSSRVFGFYQGITPG